MTFESAVGLRSEVERWKKKLNCFHRAVSDDCAAPTCIFGLFSYILLPVGVTLVKMFGPKLSWIVFVFFSSFFFLHLVGRDFPTWAVFWLCLPVQAIRTGPSLPSPLLLVGTNTLHTGTVHHGGKREMAAYPIQAAFTLSTGAAKVRLV